MRKYVNKKLIRHKSKEKLTEKSQSETLIKEEKYTTNKGEHVENEENAL